MSAALRVMLVMPAQGYARGLISGFNVYALPRGWNVNLVSHSLYEEKAVETALHRIRRDKPHALVITRYWWERLRPHLTDERTIIGAEADLSADGHPCVVVDNDAAGREAARYLMRKGLQSFAAYGLGEDSFAVERARIFRDIVEAAGCRFTGWGVGQTTLATTPGQWIYQCSAWIAAAPKPVGILACCDHWGKRLLDQLSEAGVRVPQDAVVLGIDNDEIYTALTRPPLSSVSIPWERLGQEAASLLDAVLCGRKSPESIVRIGPGSVAERASTEIESFHDRDVGAAQALIRQNADRSIGVPDLLEQIPTCRRRLEQRFRRVTGRTLMEAIREAHVERAKRLLETTDLPMAEVAEESGFSSASRFSIAFRREVQITPTAYRHRFRSKGSTHQRDT